MSSWLEDALTVVDRGMGIEQEGNEFYRKAAEQTADERGKRMFQALAGDELAHLAVLQAQRESLLRDGKWKVSAKEQTPRDRSVEAPALFPRTPAEMQRAVEPGASDLDALLVGIRIENVSYEFYDGLARKASDQAARALFTRLAAEEEGHRKLLQDTYDYLSDPAGWFQQEEKPIFEG